jgi:hypothetical protein
MRESVKLACWLTDIEPEATDEKERDDQLNHAARLYLKVSATSIDRYFMQVRRALTMAERGMVTASADYRRWFGKDAYNPAVLAKLIEMFRTYFNYCEVGKANKHRQCAWAWHVGKLHQKISCISSLQCPPDGG